MLHTSSISEVSDSVQLTCNHEVGGLCSTADKIHAADVRLVCFVVDSCHNRINEVRSKTLLVEDIAQHSGERFRSDPAVLLEFEEIQTELEPLGEGDGIRCQAGQSHE